MQTINLQNAKIDGMKFAISEIIERLKTFFCVQQNNDLAVLLGINQSTISTWKSRNTIDWDLIIAKCEKINLNWLVTGKGEMLSEELSYVETAKRIAYMTVDTIPDIKESVDSQQKKQNDTTGQLGERLRIFRDYLKLSQVAIADKIGISQQSYAKYETDRNEPSAETLSNLQFLGLSLDWLITGKGSMLEPAPVPDGLRRVTDESDRKKEADNARQIARLEGQLEESRRSFDILAEKVEVAVKACSTSKKIGTGHYSRVGVCPVPG